MTKLTTRYQLVLILSILIGLLITSCNRVGNNRTSTTRVDTIISKAKNLTDSGYPREAFRYLDSCYSQIKNPTDLELFRKYKIKADYYDVVKKDYNTAFIYIDSMLMMIGDEPDKYVNEYSNTLISKGYLLFNKYEYIEAFKCFYDGKQFAIEHNDSCTFTALNNGLGTILFNQQKYLEANIYFKLAYSDVKNCAQTDFHQKYEIEQKCLNNIALCFERAEMLDSAVYYYNIALNYVTLNSPTELGNKRIKEIATAVIKGNLGGTYANLGKYEKAEPLLMESIKVNNRLGYDRRDAQFTMIKLAQLYISVYNPQLAFKYLQMARTSLDSLAYDKAELRWRKLAWNYYDYLHDIPNAYQAYQNYIDYKTKYDLARKELAGMDFASTFDHLSQQNKIEALEQSNKVKNLYLLVAISFTILGIVIFYLIWKNYNLSNKNIEELKKLNKEITELNISKDKILAIIAHDIKGPLASLTGLMSIEENEMNPEIVRNAKKNLRYQLSTISDFLDNLLRWATSSFKNFDEIKKDEIQIYSAIENIIDLLNSSASEKNIEVENKVDTSLRLIVSPDQFKISIRNILANAIKFTPNNGKIIISSTIQNNSIEIQISDNGIGMTDEQQKKLFSNVYNSKLGTNGEKGIGLGLLIAKEYILNNNGEIRIESSEGKGTNVILSFKSIS